MNVARVSIQATADRACRAAFASLIKGLAGDIATPSEHDPVS
jgi:hypothetical protein